MNEIHLTSRVRDTVVLYGALRSGTTMLRLMLSQHPNISGSGETDFLFDYLDRDDMAWRYDRERLEQQRIYRTSSVRIPVDRDGVEALEQMIAQLCNKPGTRPLLVLHRHAMKVATLLPTAKVIHLLRDPRDVARSVIGMGWAGNVYHGIGPWMKTEDEWENATRQRQIDVYEVRFEDLVAQPEATLMAICTYLGLSYDSAMLAYDANSTYNEPNRELTFQWKRKMSERDIRRVEAALGPRLEAVGYGLSGLPALRLSPAEQLWLRAHNFLSTKGRLIGQFGLGNIVQRKLARIFGLRRLEAQAQARIDQITLRHLK